MKKLGNLILSLINPRNWLRSVRKKSKFLLILAGFLLGSVIFVFFATGEWVRQQAKPWIYVTLRSVPQKTVAIVPGAAVRPNGIPSVMLQDRLEMARALYRRGKVDRILVSGDNRTRHYNETKAMKTWLVDRGVPSKHIYADYAGFRTLDTMERAGRIFQVKDAVICTQAFHVYRSVFLARKAGIKAVGLVADRRPYLRSRRSQAREYFARTLAFADTYLLDTEPHHLGPPIPILGPPQN